VTSPTLRTATPAMWADKPMPDAERRTLGAATAAVWLFALAVNVDHVERHLRTGGASDVETTWLRWAPDVLLLVGAWKLRYRPRSAIAWSMLSLGVAWLVWAGLSMATATATGRVVSLLPILVALLMTLALEFKHADAPAVTTDAQPVSNPVDAPPVPVQPPAPDASDVQSEPVKHAKRAESTGGKRPAPSREQARVVLGALDSLDDKTNADLAREHGGTPEYWGQRKKDYRAGLAQLGAEAEAL
jgi:hypothetical protein